MGCADAAWPSFAQSSNRSKSSQISEDEDRRMLGCQIEC